MGENSASYAYCWIPISTHAEIDALKKVRALYSRDRRVLKLNLLVVRLTHTGHLGCAKPCYHCMKQLCEAKFVNIKNIYYSTADGEIACHKFSEFAETGDHYISSGYRHRMGLKDDKDKDKDKDR
jgi:hypothetical protein